MILGYARADDSIGEGTVEKLDLDLGASREGSRTGNLLIFNVYFHNSLNVLSQLG